MNVRFRIASPGEDPREYEFDRARITVGRGPTNDVVIGDQCLGRRQGAIRSDDHGSLSWHGEPCGTPATLLRNMESIERTDGEVAWEWTLVRGDVVQLGQDDSCVEIVILATGSPPTAQPEFVPFVSARPGPGDASVLAELATELAADGAAQALLRGFERLSANRNVATDGLMFVVVSGDDDFHNDTFCLDETGDCCPGPDPFAALPTECLQDPRSGQGNLLVNGETIVVPFGSPTAGSALVFRASPTPDVLRELAAVARWLEPYAEMFVARRTLQREHDALREENRYFRNQQRQHYLFKELVCLSPAMKRVHARLEQLRNSDAPVLIVGEAGTGKELLARALHHGGARADQVIIRVSCAEYSDASANLELFGAAPDGQTEGQKGVFELARGGTVFLEELDLLPPMVQAKLCRMLKEGEIRRLGESAGRPVGARLVASVHRDLAESVAEGRLRRDLYLLLKDQTIAVPALRERTEDVVGLAERFFAGFCARYGLQRGGFTEGAKRSMVNHTWPGNVRELQARIESAVLDARAGDVTPASLGLSE